MKNFTTMHRRIGLALTLAVAGGAWQQAVAQDTTPPTGPGGLTPTAPTSVPLDGGASLLLAGGVAYGLRQLRQRRQK